MADMSKPYIEGFEDTDAVFRAFTVDENEAKNYRLIAASYVTEMYEGSAVVIYRNLNDGFLYVNEGSHCSCNGLEDQWSPTKTTPEAIKHMLENGYVFSRDPSLRDYLVEWLEVAQSPDTIRGDIANLETDVAILQKKLKELREGELAELIKRRRALQEQKRNLEQMLSQLQQYMKV